jgi:uncharacterized protein YndB with AHSA1/START domain
MSVKKDPSGRRSVQVEVEVPGTPEEVWQAIATGPGVSSWFVPTEVRDDGTVVSHFGPGMDAVATRTAWEPPHRFAAEGEGFGPDAPPLATEWSVEASSGGVCVVRVVHSLFAATDDWDNQLESLESGWPWFFGILRLYLSHFRGRPCSTFRAMGVAPGPVSAAWESLIGHLGLALATVGQHRIAGAGLPPFAGVVERIGEGEHPHKLLLRIDTPAAGVVSLFAHPMGGQAFLVIDFYLYGDQAAAVVARDQPLWHAWMNAHFPMNSDSGKSC